MTNRVMTILTAGLIAAGLTLSTQVRTSGAPQDPRGVGPGSQPSGAESPDAHQRFLTRYCVTCHSQRLKTAGLVLEGLDLSAIDTRADVWEKVVGKLRGGMMPPSSAPHPDEATSLDFLNWLTASLDRAAAAHPNPGRTSAYHRLNRLEYQNAIRDVLDVEINVADLLPADDASGGFDNIAGVLKVSPALMERYLTAARKISRTAVGSALAVPALQEFRVPEELRQDEYIEGLPLGTRGGTLIRYNFPLDGEYEIKVDLRCRMPGGQCDGSAGFADRHQLEVAIDGERVHLFTAEPHTPDDEPGQDKLYNVVSTPVDWRVRVPVKAGAREVTAAFLKLPSYVEVEWRRERFMKPFYQAGISIIPTSLAIYQPYLDKVSITGPFQANGAGDTASRKRLFVCRPSRASEEAACAKKILSSVARHAYRRPVGETDLEPLLAFYSDGAKAGGFEQGIETALRYLLVSPDFIFRTEADAAESTARDYRISDVELASRLSFFLWSSIPDDELLELAARGKLSDPAVLDAQVRRMLADRRSGALVTNFVGQWLRLRRLDGHQPSAQLFPNFDDSLRDAFRRETELLFDSIVHENRSALELLTADYTFVNERLARHYGMANVRGANFRRVALGPESPRRGLLGHGSLLTLTSRPNRTSPTVRGAWILETLLGTPPPAPPAAVPALPEPEPGTLARVLSMREQIAVHRANPACSNCHSKIDPLGFALENFDAVGAWREVDQSQTPVDASGVLPDGTRFRDLTEFRSLLVGRPELFVTSVTERLLTYGLGRNLEYFDAPTVRRIVASAAPDHYKFSSLIAGVVRSTPFTFRRRAS